MRPGRKRKTEITNCTLELRVIYRNAITSISFSAHAVRRRLVAGITTRRLVEPSRRRLTIQRSQVRFLLSVSPIPEPSLSSTCPGSSPAVTMAAELSSPRTSASAPFLPNPRAPQASPPSIDASRPLHRRPNPPEHRRRGTALPPSAARRRARRSALSPPKTTSGTASPHPNGAPKPIHLCPWPPEHRRARAVPPLSAGVRGAAASDLLPANQGHPEVRLSPLYLFPTLTLAASEPRRRKTKHRPSPVLFPPPRTSREKK